ncbi:MAG: protein kinase [Myxococcales bacterium]|nr:protein kinase [Myxococcales bacterium]
MKRQPPPVPPQPPVLKPVKVSPGVMALVGKVVDRRYGIRSVIGEGGMGAVYEAEHLVLGRLVALKVLHPTNAAKPEAVSRFQHEARVVSSIGHPNICELYDVGKLEDGTPFLVMERLVGDTLADRINKEGALPPDVVFDTLLQILSGLAAAHRKGIIHRDIKPENIFLARTPGSTEPIAKLLDFGISKMSALDADLHLTRTGMVMGTPYYMAPEQARGDRIDHRVDLYAIGVILYECLTGRRPFVAPNYNALLVQILSGKPKPLRSIRPALSEAFEPIVLKAMQKQPDQRFQTATEFHDVLLRLRTEVDQESLKMEAARKLASQPPPRPRSLPPSAEIPVHFSLNTGSSEIPQAPTPPVSRVPHPALLAIPRENDTDEHVPFVTFSPSAPAPGTYIDVGSPPFDAEPTQVETAPPLLPYVPQGEADYTIPSKPLDVAEAEAIVQAAQNKARAVPLKQNPLQPPPGHLAPRPRVDSRPLIPREEPASTPHPRYRIEATRPSPLSPKAPATEPVAPPDMSLEAPILPAPGALRQPPLPRDLLPSAAQRRPVPPPPSRPTPPHPTPSPAIPEPTPSPSRVAAPPQPFPSAPARRQPPAPPPPLPEQGDLDADDNDPTMLYRPGRVKLPPELEKLREAAAKRPPPAPPKTGR